MSKSKDTKLHIEILRILAIFFVIFNHTRSDGYALFKCTELGATQIGSLSMAILCKVAVPVFFMISGALLIKKEESIKTLFVKRVLRIVLVILIFTLLQYIRLCIAKHTGFDFKTYMLLCYSGNVIEPYWYLRAYLGYLLVLPFLRAIAKSIDACEYKYLAALGFLKILIEIICLLTGYEMNVSLIICTDILFYPLLGHMIENVYYPEFLKKNVIAIPMLTGILVITVLGAEIHRSISGDWSEAFFTIAVFPMAALLYIIFKNMTFKENFAAKVVGTLGNCVFGVYLIEDVVRNVVTYRLHWNFQIPAPFISSLLFTLVCVLIGFACVFPLKKIPLINKMI